METKPKKKTMHEIFDEYLNAEQERPQVKHHYADDNDKVEMTKALIMWKFLRKFDGNWEEKRRFIGEYIKCNWSTEHRLMRLVAKIEALPTTVWRKLLWRENIDFSDYESCLRRLNDDQAYAIEIAYQDLWLNKKIPSVLKKSLRDRIKIFVGMFSVEKLLKEDYDEKCRNRSKGAYAFSLLGLDFGFALYPYGKDNDEKITNKKYTRFLSVKEHINDFVVNKEDGKYWWLYKTARSNWAFNPKKEVKMKKHVCPGFWMTLILHTLFWIVSPIALTITGLVVSKHGLSAVALIPASFAFAMIIWTVTLILRIFFRIISGAIKAAFKWVDDELLKTIGSIILVIIVGAVILAVAGVIMYIIGISINALSSGFGYILSTVFVLSSAFYVYFLFANVLRDDPISHYDEIPAAIRFFLHLSIGAFAIVLIDKYLSRPVLNFIVRASRNFWEWYTSELFIANWFLLSLIFFSLFAYFSHLYFKDEKKFANLEKTFTWLTWGFCGISTIVIIGIFIKLGSLSVFTELGFIPSLSFATIFVVAGISAMMVTKVNRSNIEERLYLAYSMNELQRSSYKIRKNLLDKLMNSKWLKELDEDKKLSAISMIDDLASKLYLFEHMARVAFIELIAEKGSASILKRFNKRSLSDLNNLYEEEKWSVICAMVNGDLTFNKALQKVHEAEVEARKFDERLSKVFTIITYPFTLIIKGLGLLIGSVVWMFRQIGRFFGTLKDLWDFFNKRCPYIAEETFLD